VALAAVALALREHHADRAWAQMLETSSVDRAAYEARTWQRTPLAGDAEPGNAFAHYAAAAAAGQASEVSPKDGSLAAALRASHDDPRVDLSAWSEPLEWLRRGARADTAKPTADVDKGFAANVQNLLHLRNLANAACATGRGEIFAGRAAEGIDHHLDALTLGIDLLRSPLLIDQMIGLAVTTIAVREGLADDVLAHLPKAELQRLATALARADAQMPATMSPRHEALFAAYHLRNVAGNLADALELSTWQAWRHGFSTRAMVAEGWLRLHEHAKTMDHAADAPWPTRSAMYEAAGEEARRSGNAFLAIVWPSFSSCEFNLRYAIAELRLLRLCVAERLGNRITLADPLDVGDLICNDGETAVTFHSVGKRHDQPIVRTVTK
jgi:hypothetical protein